MTWARLLAVVDGGSGSESVVRTALMLGEAFKARVELLHVEALAEEAIPVVAEGISAGAVEQLIEGMREQASARAETAEKLYRTHCVDAGIATCEPDAPAKAGEFRVALRHITGREADEVAGRGRLADLVIDAALTASEGEQSEPTLEAAIFETGRPLLMVPKTPPAKLGTSVVLAWDGSLEAARAASAALPLLARAEKVQVMTADMESTGAKPSELAGYLAEHGIDAKTWAFLPEDGGLGQGLLAEAGKVKADLLVMGAYRHSRLREMVLGGVTRSVMAKAEIPVLMAH